MINQKTKKLFQLKLNKEFSLLRKQYEDKLEAIKDEAYRFKQINSGHYFEKFFENRVVFLKNEISSFFSLYKKVFFNGKIDSQDKFITISRELDQMRVSRLKSFENEMNKDSSFYMASSDLKKELNSNFERSTTSIIQDFKSEAEIEYLEMINQLSSEGFMINKTNNYEYEIALSFAGENREYVEEVATILKRYINVFYDDFEKIKMWGQNLGDFFYDIYRNKSKFCMIFCSNFYKTKPWTNYERRCALERTLQEKQGYILPVLLEEVEIPGITSQTGFINAINKEPREIAEYALNKINPNIRIDFIENREKFDKEPMIIEFTIEPNNIKIGEIAILSWKVENVTYPIEIENFHRNGGKGVYNFGFKKAGKHPVMPQEEVEYKLIARNNAGTAHKVLKLEISN